MNYVDAWQSDNFLGYFINSALVALVVTAGNVVFCLWAGYAFARHQTKWSIALFATVLGVLLVPQQVIMIPLYRLMAQLGWINTYWALDHSLACDPFRHLPRPPIHSQSMPSDMEDAARIDGASEWYIMFRIVMPLSRPVLTVLAIYIFLSLTGTRFSFHSCSPTMKRIGHCR